MALPYDSDSFDAATVGFGARNFDDLARGLAEMAREELGPVLGTVTAVAILSAVLPDLENFNIRTEVVHALPLPAAHLAYAAAYGILYTAFVLTLAVLIFRRRDFV